MSAYATNSDRSLVLAIVMAALLDLGRDRSPCLWMQCAGLDEVENAIELRWVMAKLLQRALGFGVERVESPLWANATFKTQGWQVE